jgi:hypothetical protein
MSADKEQWESWGGLPLDDAPWVGIATETCKTNNCHFEHALDLEIHRALEARVTEPLAHVIGLGHRPEPWLRRYIGEALTENGKTPVWLRAHRRDKKAGRRPGRPTTESDDPQEIFERLLAGDVRPLARRFERGEWIGSKIVKRFALFLAPNEDDRTQLFEIVAIDRHAARPDTRLRKRRMEAFYKSELHRQIRKEVDTLRVKHHWTAKDAANFTAITLFDSSIRQAVIDLVNCGKSSKEAIRKAEADLGSSQPPVESVRKILYGTNH